MTEYSDDYHDEELASRISRFNDMVSSGNNNYFDVCELEEIIEYFLEKFDLENAQKAASLVLELHPGSFSAKFHAARVMCARGDLHQALDLVREVEILEADNEDVFLLKASIFSELQDHTQSIENFQRAIALSSDRRDEILVELAHQLEMKEDYSGAIESLKSALENNPENEAALHELGYCYECLDDNQTLIEYLGRFIDDHPYSSAAWYNLGNAYFRNELFDKSVWAFDYCLIIDDEFTPALFNKANALIQAERYDEAITSFEGMMAVEGVEATILCFIGECHEKAGNYSEAREHYQHALALDESCAEAMIGMAVLHEMGKEYAQSLEWYKRATETIPEESAYWHMLALAAQQAKQWRLAKKAFKSAIDLPNVDAQVWDDYSVYQAAHGHFDEAIATLCQGIEQNRDNAQLIIRMAYYNSITNCPIDAEDLLYLALQIDADGLNHFLTNCPEAEQNEMFNNIIASYKENE